MVTTAFDKFISTFVKETIKELAETDDKFNWAKVFEESGEGAFGSVIEKLEGKIAEAFLKGIKVDLSDLASQKGLTPTQRTLLNAAEKAINQAESTMGGLITDMRKEVQQKNLK